MAQFIKIARTTDLAPREAKCVEVAGEEDRALQSRRDLLCHRRHLYTPRGPALGGRGAGEEVTCPWHGAVYNIKTGAVLGPPAPRGVASYAVRVQGSDVEVEV
jgi:nitrite reductase/ring-hydroxylating ferredoxin subunit